MSRAWPGISGQTNRPLQFPRCQIIGHFDLGPAGRRSISAPCDPPPPAFPGQENDLRGDLRIATDTERHHSDRHIIASAHCVPLRPVTGGSVSGQSETPDDSGPADFNTVLVCSANHDALGYAVVRPIREQTCKKEAYIRSDLSMEKTQQMVLRSIAPHLLENVRPRHLLAADPR